MRRVETLTRINTGILVFFVIILVGGVAAGIWAWINFIQPQLDQIGGLFNQIPQP
jgi:hypothetical protein